MKIYYDDTDMFYANGGYDISKLENKFVEIVVENKFYPHEFNKFINEISNINTREVKIIEKEKQYEKIF